MLNPESRHVALDFLIPPEGSELDFALLTTYTLDLEVMLALPLQLLTCSGEDIETTLASPIQLLEALREAGEKIHVFVDRSGIAVPNSQQELSSMLEPSLHSVKAPNGGVFHPKLWILRFTGDDGSRPTIRLAVLSRNLTLDRSWDVALVSEGSPYPRQTLASNRELAGLISELTNICCEPIPSNLIQKIRDLADDVSRTPFEAPTDFKSSRISFSTLGLSEDRKMWKPFSQADRILALAPFVTAHALDKLPTAGSEQNTLITTQQQFDSISEDSLGMWPEKFTLHEGVEDEPDEFVRQRPTGLHAKLIGFEKGSKVSWYVGSANLTTAAFSGKNVEVMARITPNTSTKKKSNVNSIRGFLESVDKLLVPYVRGSELDDETADIDIDNDIEATKNAILDADLRVHCEAQDDGWTWRMDGLLELPPNRVRVKIWPVTINERSARTLTKVPIEFLLATRELTSLVAFQLHDPREEVEDVSFVLNLLAEGLPDDRMHHLLVSLISDWDKFRDFLRALLGEFWAWKPGDRKRENGSWNPWNVETLLEDLVRSASRHPDRLDLVRRLIDDIRSTEEGKKIIPDDFMMLWRAIISCVEEHQTP